MDTKMVITENGPSKSVCSEHYYTCEYKGKEVNFTVTRWAEDFCIAAYVSRLEIPALAIAVSIEADSPVEYHDESQFNDISEAWMHFINDLLAMRSKFADKKLGVLS